MKSLHKSDYLRFIMHSSGLSIKNRNTHKYNNNEILGYKYTRIICIYIRLEKQKMHLNL